MSHGGADNVVSIISPVCRRGCKRSFLDVPRVQVYGIDAMGRQKRDRSRPSYLPGCKLDATAAKRIKYDVTAAAAGMRVADSKQRDGVLLTRTDSVHNKIPNGRANFYFRRDGDKIIINGKSFLFFPLPHLSRDCGSYIIRNGSRRRFIRNELPSRGHGLFRSIASMKNGTRIPFSKF